MGSTGDEWTIRSRYGVLRDLVPIYGLPELAIGVAVLGFVFWLAMSLDRFPLGLLPVLMFTWLSLYQSRPSTMRVSSDQAAWLESVLNIEDYYTRSEADGRWHPTGKHSGRRASHHFIAFMPDSEGVTVTAPRDVMAMMCEALELLEEHGELDFTGDDRPFAFEGVGTPPTPADAAKPAIVIALLCVAAWLYQIFSGTTADWGLSGAALAQGRFETLLLHMFAHGGLFHLFMNMAVLVAIGGPLVARLGPPPLGWLRFLALYVLGGLAGAALYLALHPTGTVPMVGASGAIYGLLGLFVRLPSGTGGLLSLRSGRIRRIGWDLVLQNIFLFALLAVMAWSNGTQGGLAWEAHLGGFLFGLLAGPKFLPRTAHFAQADSALSIGHAATEPG